MRCQQCRALLPGYIQRELSAQQRVQVSRHLNNCAACYTVYIEQRQLMHDLSVTVPRLGRSEAPRLEAIRAAVMADLAHPKSPARPFQPARYSLAALLLVIALLAPLTMRSHSFDLPTAPRPALLTTPEGTAVAAIFTTETATLTATIQTNYAPVSGSTDTP